MSDATKPRHADRDVRDMDLTDEELSDRLSLVLEPAAHPEEYRWQVRVFIKLDAIRTITEYKRRYQNPTRKRCLFT